MDITVLLIAVPASMRGGIGDSQQISGSENTPCCNLTPAGVAFGDGDVSVDGEIGEALDLAARFGPFDFEPVEFFVFG
jgi:hypothetical protein